ncbi:M20/M25/M40 family metallo-hydrolase [Sporomusa sp.]|uniref:M20/M25/M40 family metallo-hydrolase n=1 Tax=Sporomusa sp. TaxID=2078658 RepID=UPI002CCBB2D6|nr:M20/M25/M40 family metallo-hydrolase [Sporomusa sp.]HWR05867.1 M20/M25/M40 family metallo-hydrolase [Sporomusa sp.]
MGEIVHKAWVGSRMKAITLELTRINSTVGTAGEVAIAGEIYRKLGELPYFKEHPGQLRLLPVRGDALGRQCVLAVVEGGKAPPQQPVRTVLGLGHMDTAGIEDYGELKEYACRPELLQEQMKSIQFSKENREDIESAEWLFGRGIFDMKAGVAALMVMIELFAQQAEKLTGNFVFLGLPDEEGASAGMLSAVQDLAGLAQSKRWEFVAAVDTDYMTGRYPNDPHKYVYLGTVGKLLPCFYIYGEETHVGEAFNGLDANLLAAGVVNEIDMCTGMCDSADGEVTLPPVSLQLRDLKQEYSVQTVNAVAVYFNHSTHLSQPEAVLAQYKEKAQQAFQKVTARLTNEYRQYCELAGIPFQELPWQANVLTFEELYQAVKAEKGDSIDALIGKVIAELQELGRDDRELSLAVVQEVHKNYSDQNSKIIVYFAPPYYPHIYVEGTEEREKQLLAAVGEAVETARSHFNYDIVMRKFYPYISDLSYCSLPRTQDSLDGLQNNMPAWQRSYSLPVEAIQRISMPVVNIGPYGKDAHKLSERLSCSYSFDAMPFILEKTLEKLLIG